VADEFKRYAVTLRADGLNKSWLYVEVAQDPKTAFIQARLRHLGKDLPPVRKEFVLRDVREV
jgi:hypothetical protein